MKGCMLKQIAFFSLVLTVATVQPTNTSVSQSKEDSMIKDASGKIAKALREKDGRVERISCTYNPEKGEVVTKTYYSDYRKRPDCCFDKLAMSQANMVEVIYKPNRESFSVIHKTNSKKYISSKVLPVPAELKA